ncbi:glycosyltransferase family 2 protein [Chitinophaga horti]|uniref:Glycosyltransferase family 2 protein n=1 Tax=Chitinophaga horti TaxID=2920382 RepID=A0ABY6J6C8_9BACT|nr:glycosyltransferase family 2 protein [Chitinophaga horti]UYQ95235.1 glycosyltransferase family 2 protein [Chitinophaga horti]
MILKLIFFASFIILFYNYVGYGLLLLVLVKIKRWYRRDTPADTFMEPPVTLLVAAYNEEDFIREKVTNTLELDYPADKLHIIYITDGSSDRTPDIIKEYPRVQLLHENARRGKTAAINRAMAHVTTPYVIFCDANTLLNKEAIRNIVKHYADAQTGGVAGEKKVVASGDANAASTEGVYWKYESLLKKWDAELYSVVGAAGELFSVRTELYEQVEPEVVLDDFIISLRICQKGFRIAYAPDAFAMESPSASITEEHKRKVRISAGGFQSIVKLKALLNIFRYPLLSFQYISHRVLRWTLSPLSLPILFVSNLLLVWTEPQVWLWQLVLALQLCFYGAAITGYFLANRNIKSKPFYIPFYFLFMNIAVFQGFFRFITKRQAAAWEKSRRLVAVKS